MADSVRGPSRRTVLRLAGGAAVAGVLPLGHLDTAMANTDLTALPIAHHGTARAVVVLPSDASTLLTEAAELLVSTIRKSTGATLRLVSAPDTTTQMLTHLYLGHPSDESAGHDEVLNDLRGRGILDGYLLWTHTKSISIVGATDDGTRFGIYEFLERFVNARWLAPTDEWEDIPHHDVLVVPPTRLVHEPAGNLGRIFFRMAGRATDWTTWCRRNRISEGTYGRLPIGHSTYKFFPPTKYAATNPEFYPIGNIPRSDSVTAGWQPAYSDADTIPIAVEYILNYFRAHPAENAISLSVNDTGGFCEQHPDHPQNPHRKNSTGFFDDMSEIYWPWVNEVVKRVRAVFPDKWFGTLAYRETLDPPATELDDHILVIICKDNYTWVDPAVRANCEWRIAEWSAKASHIGYWEYAFGSTYALPRMYPTIMNQVFSYAGEYDPEYWIVQTGTTWSEGPKYWVLSKLMWDPNADANALTAEWCRRAVGPAAAPFVQRYFDIWEEFWRTTAPQTKWFQDYKNFSYLWFPSADYLDVANPADLQVSRRLLERAITHAQTDMQRRRAHVLLELFEYYETAFFSWPRKKPKADTTAAGLAVVNEVAQTARTWEHRVELVERWTGLDRFAEDQIRGKWDYAFGWTTQTWDYWKPNDFTVVTDYLRRHRDPNDPVRQLLESGRTDTSEQVRRFSQLVLGASVGSGPHNGNSSFEASPPLDSWTVTSGSTITASAARTGAAGLRISDTPSFAISRDISLRSAELIAVTAHYRSVTTGNGSIRIDLGYLSSPPAIRTSELGTPVSLQTGSGQWRSLSRERVCPFLRPPAIQQVRLTVRLLNLAPSDVVDLDDITIYTATN